MAEITCPLCGRKIIDRLMYTLTIDNWYYTQVTHSYEVCRYCLDKIMNVIDGIKGG